MTPNNTRYTPRTQNANTAWASSPPLTRNADTATSSRYDDARFTAVFSRPPLLELLAVVARPQFMLGAPSRSTDAAALLALIDREPLVAIADVSQGWRDPKDDAVIGTALRGRVSTS